MRGRNLLHGLFRGAPVDVAVGMLRQLAGVGHVDAPRLDAEMLDAINALWWDAWCLAWAAVGWAHVAELEAAQVPARTDAATATYAHLMECGCECHECPCRAPRTNGGVQ